MSVGYGAFKQGIHLDKREWDTVMEQQSCKGKDGRERGGATLVGETKVGSLEDTRIWLGRMLPVNPRLFLLANWFSSP